MARSAAFGSKIMLLDEPTAALGVTGGHRVLQLMHTPAEAVPIMTGAQPPPES